MKKVTMTEMASATSKKIYEIDITMTNLDDALVRASFSDPADRPPLLRVSSFPIRIVTRSLFVRVLNWLPFVDLNGAIIGPIHTVYMLDGNKKWGLLGHVNWPVVHGLAFYVAHKRLNHASWFSFYYECLRQIWRYGPHDFPLRQLARSHYAQYFQRATRTMSESTC